MERDEETTKADTDRRAFLATAGKFAVITPPAMTVLLSTTLTSPAIAASGRGSYEGAGQQGQQGGQGRGQGKEKNKNPKKPKKTKDDG